MGPADSWDHPWAGILFLAASLLTVWSLPTAAHLTPDAHPLNAIQEMLAKPTISVSQDTAIEHREETVTFICDAKDVNIIIHWVINNHDLAFDERMQLSQNGKNLTILKVQRKDSGAYQCEARGAPLLQSSDPTILIVYYGPDPTEIKVAPGVPNGEVVGLIEGSNVTFSVETQSYPSPAYSWFFHNDSIPSLTTSSFIIHTVSRKHEGTYRCLVSNSVTGLSVEAALKVRVFERLAQPYIVSPSLDLLENASSVPLTCQTTQEGARVQWFVRGQPFLLSKHMVLSADNKTLTIHSLWRNDTGPYECEVWNWDIWVRSRPLWLNISYGPDGVIIISETESRVVSNIKVELNSNLALQCQAESQPVAEYHWTLVHSSSVHMGEKLTIAALSWEHQGIYTCMALNSVTHLTHSASVQVTVVGPQSSLSAGAIAGIAIGILTVITLSAGLGYFLYIKKARGPSKKTPKDCIYETTTTPTSEREHTSEPSSDRPRLMFANIPETQGQVRVKEMLSPETPEKFYEKVLTSETQGRCSYLPKQPKSTLQPSVPAVPERNIESNYEVLVNATCSVYCVIKRSV